MNYKEQSINSEARPVYGRICRPCRERVHEKQQCPGCEKMRRTDAFIHNPHPDNYQDTICLRCRRMIEREWSKGRWAIEGFTSLPSRGHHSFVRCDECLLEMDRRHVKSHRC